MARRKTLLDPHLIQREGYLVWGLTPKIHTPRITTHFEGAVTQIHHVMAERGNISAATPSSDTQPPPIPPHYIRYSY